jgi:[ribosomal protein S5]-alanine N-acetyltransferase
MLLHSKRLVLAPLTIADGPVLHAMWTSPGGRRFLWDDEIIPMAQTAELVQTSQQYFAQHGVGLWLARERVTRFPVGYAGFWYFRTPPELELLYGIDEAYWGRGYATEAARALMQYGFEQLGLEQIVASTDAPNKASVRVMEKSGMCFDRRVVISGRETIFYRIDRMGVKE